ncbi:hypothetical protein ACOXPD_004056 [Escherichia coli O5:H32]|jgi:hypothetical protein|uniref:hypothetical protein n=1 Tax=Enterobacteriaceae TaxID=543 RepID=UPI0002728A52|nr:MULTISPECIES: hypothetical protein [Enterobacteriaceae]EFS3971201.1 hypothetical protein [Shigella sonnei]ESA31594.1 hypothetical protein L912_2592 [Escherichia coli SCD1]MCG1031993.1 hypothetical protein [Bacillus amyloliquefaciens]EEU9468669.1 hypothetical protein [Escherichia coli]EFE6297777.1 hypothetical protein [Escherichia coli]
MGSMLELEKEVAELKQKLLTHEIATGLILSDIVKLLDIARPGALDALTKNYQAGQAKIPESAARNDPHTIDAFTRILKVLEVASKK